MADSGTDAPAGSGWARKLAAPRAEHPVLGMPTAGEDSGATESSETSGARQHGNGRAQRRAVIVEDEFVIAMELEDMLRACGFEVVGVAHDADEAVRLVGAERPDVVTMDVNLPGDRDGISAATEIFERYGLRSLFISAYCDEQTRSRAEPARPLGWLAKPLNEKALARSLQSLPPARGDA